MNCVFEEIVAWRIVYSKTIDTPYRQGWNKASEYLNLQYFLARKCMNIFKQF